MWSIVHGVQILEKDEPMSKDQQRAGQAVEAGGEDGERES